MWKVALCLIFIVESIPMALNWGMATNCPLSWSNTKFWSGGCRDYAEQLHWPFMFNRERSRCGWYFGNDLYVQNIFLWFIFLRMQFLRQKTKNSRQDVTFPGVIRKRGLSFPGVVWNRYTASSKRTFFEQWHKYGPVKGDNLGTFLMSPPKLLVYIADLHTTPA